MLEPVQDLRIAVGTKGVGDDASVPSTAEAPETVRVAAHAGPEAAAEQSVPDPAGPGPEQSVRAGPLSRLLSKIPADPTEILEALEDLAARISERVVREIRAFRGEFETRLESMETRSDARLESMETRSDARHDVQDAKIDAFYKLYDGLLSELSGLRSLMRLLVAMLGIQLVLLGALITMGFMSWFSTDRVPASPPSLEVQAPQAEPEESASVLGSPPPASASASEDEEGPAVDTAEEAQLALPPAR